MARKPKSTEDTGPIDINVSVDRGVVDICIIGTTPLITNSMSGKAWRDLMLPPLPKNAATKAANLKHDPVQEFRDSAYQIDDPRSPARVMLKATAFKRAIRDAALDLPGVAKAQIGRWIFIPGDYVGVYGIPRLRMDVVRNADIAKTPDIRTRATIEYWCARFSVHYSRPFLTANTVVNLAATAGIVLGVGDFRQEKGLGSFGSFALCQPNDPEFMEICRTGGWQAQTEAFEHPVAYNAETEAMLAWFDREIALRGRVAASSQKAEPKATPKDIEKMSEAVLAAAAPAKRGRVAKANGVGRGA